MANSTDIRLRNQVIYSLFIRNHTLEGTFSAAEKDLDRIKALGTDIIWLLPIHPSGVKGRKGALGCPYAVSDYRTVNPAYGTLEDFVHLVDEIHKRDMKCLMDVVYNHTSLDSQLAQEHPEYFYQIDGEHPGSRVGDWSDVVDLDYRHEALWKYQIETLCMWAKIVDGFRCDVASLVPAAFWKRCREEVEKVKPGCIWLAETIHAEFVRDMRTQGFHAWSDGELYEAFDITYEYDIEQFKEDYIKGRRSLREYIDVLNLQDCIYPENYVKLRFLENHDQSRAKHKFRDETVLRNWTAFLYFQKGAVLLYAGQEVENVHTPSLYDMDKVNWSVETDLSDLLKTLYSVKKDEIFSKGAYSLRADQDADIVVGKYRDEQVRMVGIFSLRGNPGQVKVKVPDGEYVDLISSKPVVIRKGTYQCSGHPVMFKAVF